ncbi:hypothetical protein F5X98DRAFT_367556 [Xylaria grammica]|nr:hypothetical protein F5X98DRAFT_367556 [Xylaria grammica]
MSYAYYTTIFQDARRTDNTRYTGPQPTYELIKPYTRTPLAPIPISRSPRSRPFMAFANSAPVPPPDWCRFYVSPEERARKAANAAWVARQRQLYAMEGHWPATPEPRRWNGRVFRPPPPSRSQVVVQRAVLALAATAAAVADAVKAEFRRHRAAYAARKARLAFWVSRTNYRFIQRRQAVAIELRLIFAHFKPILTVAFWVLALGMMVLRVCMIGAD